MTAPPREHCEWSWCHRPRVKGSEFCAYHAAPAPHAAQPAEPPATDAETVSEVCPICDAHFVGHALSVANVKIVRQARKIAEAKRSEEHTRAVLRVAERDYKERLSAAQGALLEVFNCYDKGGTLSEEAYAAIDAARAKVKP